MTTFLLIIHFFITIALVAIILIQRSDGSGLGLGEGGGGMSGLVTGRGAANLLTRTTAILAALFMGNCLLLAHMAARSNAASSILITTPAAPAFGAVENAPAAPTSAPAQ